MGCFNDYSCLFIKLNEHEQKGAGQAGAFQKICYGT